MNALTQRLDMLESIYRATACISILRLQTSEIGTANPLYLVSCDEVPILRCKRELQFAGTEGDVSCKHPPTGAQDEDGLSMDRRLIKIRHVELVA